MSIVEASISVPAEHETNVFGQYDQHIKKMERALNITVVNRDGVLKIIGGETAVNKARKIFEQLIELSKHGNIIQEQNVDYAIALSYEDKEEEPYRLIWPWRCRSRHLKTMRSAG